MRHLPHGRREKPCAILAAVLAAAGPVYSYLDARPRGSNSAPSGVARATVLVAMGGGKAAPRARTAGPLPG